MGLNRKRCLLLQETLSHSDKILWHIARLMARTKAVPSHIQKNVHLIPATKVDCAKFQELFGWKPL